MLEAWSQIRPKERSDTIVATLSLFAFICSQALLATARDALFLASIPAINLPWVYIAGAALALIVARGIAGRQASSGRRLSGWLLGCSAVTLAFWPLVATQGLWVLYALYIWSALAISVIVARFFVLLGDLFTVTQAKRLYAAIGVGSALGAIAGSGLAALISMFLPAPYLLAAAAVMLAVSAIGPGLLGAGRETRAKPAERSKATPAQSGRFSAVMNNAYARRLATVVLLGTVIFTLVDFVFKSTVAHEVEAAGLAQYFSRFYFTVNVLSLLVQLFLVRPMIRVFGTIGVLAILPVFLVLGALGTFVVAGIAGVLALKGADGSLRNSMHRTVVEMLYLPLGNKLRKTAKIVIDVAGQRGGKALASIAILAGAALGADSVHLIVAIGVLALVWLGLTVELRKHYLNLFRATLAEAAGRTELEFPDLDVASLESLIAALNSQNDAEVQAALRLLAEGKRQRLIPALILYHPSPPVLVEALSVLSAAGRTDFLPMTDRLLNHEYADVRAAALRARIAASADEALLRSKMEVNCPVVKSTALVGLLGSGYTSISETDPYLNDIIDNGSNVAREALARAIGFRPSPAFEGYLLRLSEIPDTSVKLSVARSMATMPSKRFLPQLLAMLPSRDLRPAARKTLVEMGGPALTSLGEALKDETLPVTVRRHLPRTLLLFEPHPAAEILVARLPEEQDGIVRYKILRALGSLAARNPELVLDTGTLRRALNDTLARAFRYIDWRITLERGAKEDPARATEAHNLLTNVLNDKERNAIERIFRLLGLLFRDEDLAIIYRGLGNVRRDVGSSSRELLMSFLDPELSEAVLGLIDDVPDPDRLRAGATFHKRENLSYVALLTALLEGQGDSLRSLAVYQVGALGLQEFRARIEAITPPADGFLPVVLRQTAATLVQLDARITS